MKPNEQEVPKEELQTTTMNMTAIQVPKVLVPPSTTVITKTKATKATTTESLIVLNTGRRILYISHFVQQFSEKAWLFAIVLFLAAITDYQSLVLVSTYGICSNGAVFIFGSKVGRFVDTSTNRLHTARIFIWTENICVIVASICCYLLLRTKANKLTTVDILSDPYPILLLVGIHIFGPVAQILDGGFLVAIERDWVVVMGTIAQKFLQEEDHQQHNKDRINNEKDDDNYREEEEEQQQQHNESDIEIGFDNNNNNSNQISRILDGIEYTKIRNNVSMEKYARPRDEENGGIDDDDKIDNGIIISKSNKKECIDTDHGIVKTATTTTTIVRNVIDYGTCNNNNTNNLDSEDNNNNINNIDKVDDPSSEDNIHSGKNHYHNIWLIQTNVLMKQIDLTCQVAAPAIAGLLIGQFGTIEQLSIAAIAVSVVNVISLLVGYWCTSYIYYVIPELSYNNTKDDFTNNTNTNTKMNDNKDGGMNTNEVTTAETSVDITTTTSDNGTEHTNNYNIVRTIEKVPSSPSHVTVQDEKVTITKDDDSNYNYNNNNNKEIDDNDTSLMVIHHHDEKVTTTTKPSSSPVDSTSTGLYATVASYGYKWIGIYFQQPVWYAGFGLALLYFNALTFGGLMMNYLLYRGMSMGQVGIWRGVSSAIGLVGTIAYKVSANHLKLSTTGMWSIVYQLTFISFSFVSMFISDFTISMVLLVFGVCTSRIGLYVFEITVTQLMQEYIPESIRGNIGGIQNSLNAFFQLSSFVVCVIYPNPKDFIIVVTVGYIAVGCAAILYAFGIFRRASQFC